MYLRVNEISKSYGVGEAKTDILKQISLKVKKGEMCVVLGPSGSGKSTLLNIIGALDQSDSGEIIVDGKNITKMNKKQRSLYRREKLGFVFQFYNLVPDLTVRENIQVCENLAKTPIDINELIQTLGLEEHQNKFPSQLSGGQQQRCAIARALIKKPELLLCDEPTGALDYKTSKEMLVLMEKVNKKYGITMIIITHNEAIKDMVHHVIKIKDGRVSKDYENKQLIPAANLEW